MKLTAIISLLAIILLGSTGTTPAQPKSCAFDIVGTWQAQLANNESRLYRFDADGNVTVLSVSGKAEPREIARGSYELADDPKAPTSITLTSTGKNRILVRTSSFTR